MELPKSTSHDISLQSKEKQIHKKWFLNTIINRYIQQAHVLSHETFNTRDGIEMEVIELIEKSINFFKEKNGEMKS